MKRPMEVFQGIQQKKQTNKKQKKNTESKTQTHGYSRSTQAYPSFSSDTAHASGAETSSLDYAFSEFVYKIMHKLIGFLLQGMWYV